ncbi:hypothetical protein LL033_25680 (plasmid) [Clostridium estertheticum]|uniref:hypothetical protein n=1 Tax=Clostridium estertheticum TaxID=238834 RepID=UPI001C0A9CC3|nr:hypothetical protein [Clostridium estertheticum]MBU3217375.1 hypothetical protein [Clostridium estertheticum]WAG58151.1 hypothetical protein LL033_25680 [Clostridium estertheticum]
MKYFLNGVICFFIGIACWFLVGRFIDKNLALIFALFITLAIHAALTNKIK